MANIVNVTVDDTAFTVNVTVSDGVITADGGGTFIDGFWVTKGAGNIAATIEVGDLVDGWIGLVKIAGRVNSIPIGADVSNIDPATQGEIL